MASNTKKLRKKLYTLRKVEKNWTWRLWKLLSLKRWKHLSNIHLFIQQDQLVLWHYTKTNLRLKKLLEFLHRTFCQLFSVYYLGNECFCCFLAVWYKEIGTLICDSLSTQNTSTLWRYVSPQ